MNRSTAPRRRQQARLWLLPVAMLSLAACGNPRQHAARPTPPQTSQPAAGVTAHRQDGITARGRRVGQHTPAPTPPTTQASNGCLARDETMRVDAAATPSVDLCVSAGTRVTILLAAAGIGRWKLPLTSSNPQIAAVSDRPGADATASTGPDAVTITVDAYSPGRATIGTYTVPADPSGPPTLGWNLYLTVAAAR
jgi:hypothetical protein